MWNVDPKLLCRNHLLGEHRELHALVGMINKGIRLGGYIDNGLIEVHTITERHKQLVFEMEQRGYNHKSPLQKFNEFKCGIVDSDANLIELQTRCEFCKKLIEKR
jgi:hypothetical protein